MVAGRVAVHLDRLGLLGDSAVEPLGFGTALVRVRDPLVRRWEEGCAAAPLGSSGPVSPVAHVWGHLVTLEPPYAVGGFWEIRSCPDPHLLVGGWGVYTSLRLLGRYPLGMGRKDEHVGENRVLPPPILRKL